MNDEIRTIMTLDPVTAQPDMSVEDVAQLMIRERLQQLPVVDGNNHLVGLVTSYDLWRHSREGGSPTMLVADIMTRKVVKLAPKDKVGTAAELFMDKRFKTFPVVNLDNELKGVITAFDVIRYTLGREYPKDGILYEI